MKLLFPLLLPAICINSGCKNASGKNAAKPQLLISSIDTVIQENNPVEIKSKSYDSLVLSKEETLKSAPGTKSVLFNSNSSKLYAMNLEGMSVYEFDQSSKKIIKQFRFIPTKGMGWNYQLDKPEPSLQEKPVEACLTNHDSVLWVSLHNAEGIVPIRLYNNYNTYSDSSQSLKNILVIHPGSAKKDTIKVPLIKTGKTPKVISATSNDKYLLVSNWHSNSVSIVEINNFFPYGKVIKQVPVTSIPRGIAINDKMKESYIAIMGGSKIHVIDNDLWQTKKYIKVASNPRHIVTDSNGRLFVSFNKLSRVACIDPVSGETLFSTQTDAQPRTVKLSKNNKFLFVTCYGGETIDIFKIYDRSFVKIASLPCSGKPVGVDLYEDDKTLEAWVCSYINGKISVYTFNKI